MENKWRSVVKAFSWRMIGTITTTLITLVMTGSVKTAFSIGGISMVLKFFLYYLHERMWNKIKWGKE